MRELLHSLDALLAKIHKRRSRPASPLGNRLLEQPSREDVLFGFRMILGREPENEDAINAHMAVGSVAELRGILLNSDEFKGKFQSMDPEAREHPGLSMDRETLLFIHLQKTGGTTLRAMLAENFPADRRCPILEDKLHLLSASALCRYDFFAGHFDQTSIRLIPRTNIKTVALLRDPRARLVSFYRFLSSHPVGDEFAGDSLVRLANSSTAEEFFEAPEARSFSAVYNHYTIALGGSFCWFDRYRPTLSAEDFSRALAAAKRQIHALTALGITERFEQSVELIGSALNLRVAPPQKKAHVTDEFPDVDPRFRRVEPVTMTPRLAAALEELTAYDSDLYRYAVQEFDKRYAGLRLSARASSG
jgi:hypothetical protein